MADNCEYTSTTESLQPLRLVNSERIIIALRNAHFQYRGSIKYLDTRDGSLSLSSLQFQVSHNTT